MIRLLSKVAWAWLAGSGIFLCASPPPGPNASPVPAIASSSSAGEEVADTINRELRRRGTAEAGLISTRDLAFPETLPVRARNSLEVSSLSWDVLLRAWQFRLRCRDRAACLPFLVTARLPAARFAKAGQEFDTAGKLFPAMDRASPATRPLRHPATSKLVKPGQPAKVVVEGDGLRITVQVVCLEGGSEGQWIRVRHRDSHGIFRARVVAAGLLESAIPAPEEVLP